jgi:Flp pilus assembly protein TadD
VPGIVGLVATVTFARARRLDEAIDAVWQAIHHRPDYAEAILNLARAYEQKGNTEEAALTYRELLRVRPRDASAYNALRSFAP